MPLDRLAKDLRNARGDKPMKECAREIGISTPTVMRVEHGQLPSLAVFVRLCEWLRVSPMRYLRDYSVGPPLAGRDVPQVEVTEGSGSPTAAVGKLATMWEED